jgi:hypothetical protein
MAEPLRATFYTLKKHGPRGGVLLGATLMTGVLLVALLGVTFALCYPILAPMFPGGAASATANGAEVIGAMFGVIGIIFLVLFAMYVLFAAYEAACLRWMIRQEAPGWFGLTLGADTWRVYAGYWIWLVIYFVVSTIVSLLMMPVMFMMMPSIVQAGGEPDLSGLMAFQLGMNVLLYIPMIFFGVRFGPAAATSIARRRFAFFDAWTVTKGRFWELLGSFALLMSAYVILTIVFVGFVLGSIFRGQFPSSTSTPQELETAFAAIFTPTNLAVIGGFYLLLYVVGIFYVVFSFGVNARAVIAAVDEGKIEGQTPNVAQVFE